MTHALADKLPIWHFDENLMVFSDGSLGAGFKLNGMDISCTSTESVNNFNRRMGSLLTSIPEGLSLQVFYRLTPHVSETIKEHEKISVTSNKAQQEIVQARIDFLNKHQGEYFLPETYLFLRGEPLKYKRQGFWKSQEKFQQSSKQEYDEHKKTFERNRRQLFFLLKDGGLAPVELESSQWTGLLFEYFNLSRSEKVGPPHWKENGRLADLGDFSGLSDLGDIKSPEDIEELEDFEPSSGIGEFEPLSGLGELEPSLELGEPEPPSSKFGLHEPLSEFYDLFAPSLAHQILFTDIGIYEDCIKCGNYFFQVITMKTLPEEETHAAMIHHLTSLPFHFWLLQNIQIHRQKSEVEKLKVQRRLAHSMTSSPQNISDLESESKLYQIEDLMRELLEGSEKLVSTDLNVIIWGKGREELTEKADEVLSAFKRMNQSEGVVETLPGFEAFSMTFPGSTRGLRPKKMKSSNVAHLMPLYSYWRGHSKPVCLFPNRYGVLFSMDPFAKELTNWNALIFGGSGVGKSFTISQMMLQFCTQTPRPKIIWVDNGASSQRLLEVHGGEFINLNIDSKIRLNMFDLSSEDQTTTTTQTTPTTSKVKLILAVLESILKDEEKRGLPKREKALLEEAIFQTYEQANSEQTNNERTHEQTNEQAEQIHKQTNNEQTKGRVPILSDLRKILSKHEVLEMRNFAQTLYSWTGNTAYGQMLDGPSNVKLTKDLITIETKGLDAYPDLQNVFLLLFTDFIKSEAARDLSTPYLLIIDEAWKLFETPSGLSFAMEAYRTFRKFNGGIWCISQNYKDFLSSQEIKNAIFPNTASVFILRQKKIDWKDFQEVMDFNNDEVEVIKSLSLEKGRFSEFFFMQDENKAVIRLTPDPLSYWICTTDGFDKAAIEAMARKYPKLPKLEILKKIAFEGKKEAP